MPYKGNVWKDGPDGRTPITAAKLTKIEDGITSAQAEAEKAQGVADQAKAAATNANGALNAVNAAFALAMDAVVPIGAVLPFYGTRPPKNWLLCYGQEVSRTDYKALFDVIGTSAGGGDGSTTFNVPDLRGKVIYGQGQSDFTLITGTNVGETHHTLTLAEMPSHGHEIVEHANRNARWRVAVASTDIGAGDSGSGYTYQISSGSSEFSRRPYATDVGGGNAFPMRPRGSVASMIIRAK